VTNLYYYRARYYDPTAGRFLSEDPIRFESGTNFYRYVRNNPLLYPDRFGLSPTSDGSCDKCPSSTPAPTGPGRAPRFVAVSAGGTAGAGLGPLGWTTATGSLGGGVGSGGAGGIASGGIATNSGTYANGRLRNRRRRPQTTVLMPVQVSFSLFQMGRSASLRVHSRS